MALSSSKSDTHSHLARSSKRHSGIHTVTPSVRTDREEDQTKREPPFGKLVFDEAAPVTRPTKSMFGL